MRHHLTRLIGGILLASGSTGALAQAYEWRVSEASGPVTIVTGEQKRAAARGMRLQPGDAVQAGAGGRVILVHNRDFVTVSSNSRITVPAAEKQTGYVKLLQDWGQALFKIEKKGAPHFGVNTPSLAAVVKGTTFSITVDQSGSALQVTEGAVEVATLDGGARDVLRPGGLATVSSNDLYRLTIRADDVRVLDSPVRPQADEGAATPQASVGPSVPDTAPASEPTAAPVREPAAAEFVTIDMPVNSKPVDLGQVTGGLVIGSAAVTQLAAVTADIRAVVAAPVPVPAPDAAPAPPAAAPAPVVGSSTPAAVPGSTPKPDPTPPAGGQLPGNAGGGSDNGKGTPGFDNPVVPGNGDAGKPGKPDDGDKAGKPEVADKPAKPDDAGKPGKLDDGDKAGKPEVADKPAKPDDADKPGKPDEGDKPGKSDDSGKPGKPDNGDDPGKPQDADKPGKPDDGGKPGKPDGSSPPTKPDDLVDLPGKANDRDTRGPRDGETHQRPR